MPRTRIFPLFVALLLGVFGVVRPAWAQPADRTDTLSDLVLPCGVRAALASIGDQSTPDRGHFILEISRRMHHTPAGPNGRIDALPALIEHLDRCEAADTAETLPLPLPVSTWVDAVFNSRVNPKRLAAAILASRNASLLYIGLLSLDEGTRAWMGGRPELIAEIATRHAAAFTLIAPGLRASNAGVQVPGGAPAEPVWEALAGRSPKEPAEFIRALLAADDRHLPYMFGTLAQLSPRQAHLALNLDARDKDARIASARRLNAVYVHVAQKWRADLRAFWRPTYDPALLASDFSTADDGRPILHGTQRFWDAVFAPGRETTGDPRELAKSDPVEFAWLCERVFEGDIPRHYARYHQVLFASRVLRNVTADQAIAAAEAVHAARLYPALAAALERAGVVDIKVIAAAARRASRLADIGSASDTLRATAQFQGVLTLLQRATLRDSLTTSRFAELVTSLAAVDLENEGYQGRLVRWLDANLPGHGTAAASTAGSPGAAAAATVSATAAAAGLAARSGTEDFEAQPLEGALLDLVAGPSSAGASSAAPPARVNAGGTRAAARIVEWEGTRYRVDLAAAETARLQNLRGEAPRPYVSAARALIGIADALNNPKLSAEALTQEARTFARVADAVGWTNGRGWGDGEHWLGTEPLGRAREAAAALERAGQRGDRGAAARLAPSILVLADILLARGVTHLVYATALGHPERAEFVAEEAAAHHDFGAFANAARNRLGPWEHPVPTSGGGRDSRVKGALFGLDVALSQLSLVRLSSRPPAKRPTVNENDRRALTESVVLIRELTDADRDRIVGAIRKGRERSAAITTPEQAAAIADEIGISGARRSLMLWNVTRAPDRMAAFLSPTELLWLGLGSTNPVDARLHAWGAPARARLGCLCLQFPDRRPPEPFTGRWGSGIFVSTFPDLNLRLAELLAELQMPAALVGPVLTSATLDFVNNASSRDSDDRRGLVEFVQALTLDRAEQYLALLTTDGPLVPIGKAANTSVSTGVPR